MKKIYLYSLFLIFSTLLFAYDSPFSNGEVDVKIGVSYPSSYSFTSGTYFLNTTSASQPTFQVDFLRNFSQGNALGLGIGFFSVPFENNNLSVGIYKESSNFDLIPIYMIYRQNFSNIGDMTPYFSWKVGYTASLNHSEIIQYTGGLYGGIALGVTYQMLLLEVQYNIAQIAITSNSPTLNVSPNIYTMNGVSLVTGLKF